MDHEDDYSPSAEKEIKVFDLYRHALKAKDFHILEWLISICKVSSDVIKYVIDQQDLKQLQWMIDNSKFKLSAEISAHAASLGSLEILMYLHEQAECPWDEWTCAFASQGGFLDCLMYAHKNGCPWNEWTCTYAVWNRHKDCLMYALENGCPQEMQWSRSFTHLVPRWTLKE